MKLLKLVPDDTQIPFIKWRYVALLFSTVLMVLSAVLFFSRGLNFGIDFSGGTLIEIRLPQAADLGQIRGIVGSLGLGDVKIQGIDEPTDVAIFVQAQSLDSPGASDEAAEEAREQAVAAIVQEALAQALGSDITYLRIEVVGPKVSGELVQKGTIAVVFSLLSMLVYIWLRFEWQFSVGAVLALIHDVILTVGMFALVQLEFNLTSIAAILTIVGYSMNDTVIIYDRIRENLRKYKKMPLQELIDLSLNNTLSRTIMTSGTTLLALFSLYSFGGEVIRSFTFAMIWGIFVGTYSTLYVASSLLLFTGVKREWAGAGVKAVKARP